MFYNWFPFFNFGGSRIVNNLKLEVALIIPSLSKTASLAGKKQKCAFGNEQPRTAEKERIY